MADIINRKRGAQYGGRRSGDKCLAVAMTGTVAITDEVGRSTNNHTIVALAPVLAMVMTLLASKLLVIALVFVCALPI